MDIILLYVFDTFQTSYIETMSENSGTAFKGGNLPAVRSYTTTFDTSRIIGVFYPEAGFLNIFVF